jgi:hypothetical protein
MPSIGHLLSPDSLSCASQPKTWNIAREPLLVAINLINRILYSKEASRRQRKQLLPLVPKEAISKEAISKEAIPKEAILNAPTSLRPLPPNDENDRAHKNIKLLAGIILVSMLRGCTHYSTAFIIMSSTATLMIRLSKRTTPHHILTIGLGHRSSCCYSDVGRKWE